MYETLAAFDPAQQRNGRWTVVAATSLAQMAKSLPLPAGHPARLAAHRVERAAFGTTMAAVDQHLEKR